MGQSPSQFWEQSFFIKAPTLTDKNLPDQTGKVCPVILLQLLQLLPQNPSQTSKDISTIEFDSISLFILSFLHTSSSH